MEDVKEIITLPTNNPFLLRQLRLKLVEYCNRNPKKDVPTIPEELVDEAKRIILELVLSDGEVGLGYVIRKVAQEFGSTFRANEFVDHVTEAFEVIQDYCETGGEDVEGGALPFVPMLHIVQNDKGEED